MRLRKPGTLMLTGGDGSGRISPPGVGLTLPETEAGGRSQAGHLPGRYVAQRRPAVPAVDRSCSAAMLENNRDRIEQFAVLFFNVETFWWQEKFVANTPENVEALMKLCRRPGPGRGHRPGPGACGSGTARLAGRRPGRLARPAICSCSSDGAATWGEDHWPVLSGKFHAAAAGPLFAYRTGLAGGDPRLLAHLAQQSGGAVFSVVGEAEIARAATAHRSRPWRLTGVEMAGGQRPARGRPAAVRLPRAAIAAGRPRQPIDPKAAEVVLTLTRDQANHATVRTKIDRVLASELAARDLWPGGHEPVGRLGRGRPSRWPRPTPGTSA